MTDEWNGVVTFAYIELPLEVLDSNWNAGYHEESKTLVFAKR